MSQENIVKESSSAVVADCSTEDLSRDIFKKLSRWVSMDEQNRGAFLVVTDSRNVGGSVVGLAEVVAAAVATEAVSSEPFRKIFYLASETVKLQSAMTGDAPSDGSKENDKDII